MRTITRTIAISILGVVGWGITGAGETDAARARIDVQADGYRKISVREKDKGVEADNATWRQDVGGKDYIYAILPTKSGEWTQSSFTIESNVDLRLTIRLKSHAAKEGEKVLAKQVLIDDVTVEGAQIVNGDFEKAEDGAPVGWTANNEKVQEGYPKAEYVTGEGVAHSGKACVKVWHDGQFVQTIDIKGKTPVKITAWCKAVE